MNILILNWRDIKHPLAGGAEVTVYQHAKYWQKKGAHITWFTSSFEGGNKEEIIDGMRIIRRGSHYTVQGIGIWYYLSGKLGKPDIIIDCFHFIPFYTPLYVPRKRIIALIHEVADKLWFKNIYLPIAIVGYLVERFSFIFYKKVQFITVSESTKSDLLRHGIPSRNISVIHNGSSSKALVKNASKENLPTITFLGRISLDKGINEVLLAFDLLAEKDTKIQLWIMGKEEKKGDVLRLIEENITSSKAKNRIHYWGYVPDNVKVNLLERSWLLIHPSEKEGWGLTVIEAASQGTPTVGYNVEGLKDSIIHNKTGLLTDNNPESLAEAIREIINDKNRYNRLSQEALKWSKNFDWEKSSKKSFALIKRLLS